MARQDVSLLSAAWRMLHSTVRRVDYITGLVTTLQDVVRYLMMQPSGMTRGTKDPPFQLVNPYVYIFHNLAIKLGLGLSLEQRPRP